MMGMRMLAGDWVYGPFHAGSIFLNINLTFRGAILTGKEDFFNQVTKMP